MKRPPSIRVFAVLLLTAIVVKGITLIIDPDFYFYIGDSNEYLKTATEGYYPTARSWLYGELIRIFTGLSDGVGNLQWLVLSQSLATAMVASLGGWVAVQIYRAPLLAGAVLTALFALTPHQLLYDRAVLTEAFSSLGFIAMLVLGILYIETRRTWILVTVAMAGVVALSLRLAFMPLSWGIALILPPLAWWGWKGDRVLRFRSPMILGLGVALLSTLAGHTAYQHLTASQANRHLGPGDPARRPAAYQYDDGWFTLASRVSCLEPKHGATEEMENLIATSELPLERGERGRHLWRGDGLRARGFQEFGEHRGNELAKWTAVRCLFMSPLSNVKLSAINFASPYTKQGTENALREDLNSYYSTEESADLLPEYAERIEKHFGVEDMRATVRKPTLAKRWFEAGSPLMTRLLQLSPFLALGLALIPVFRKSRRVLLFLGLVGLAYLALISLLVIADSFRLVVPLEAILMLTLAVVAGTVLRPRVLEDDPSLDT